MKTLLLMRHAKSSWKNKSLEALATPAEIIAVDKIPKNRSGKVMRRYLRSIYNGTDPGDLSTMEEE